VKLNAEDLDIFIEKEDVAGLCDLAQQYLTTGLDTDRLHISGAIQSILNLWLYDFSASKGGDPSKYPVLRGLETVEALNQESLLVERAEFFFICSGYYIENGDLKKALHYAQQCESVLQNALEKNPDDVSAYSQLIELYQRYPATDENEAQKKYTEAIDLVNSGILISDLFLKTKISLLYPGPDPKSLPATLVARIQFERDALTPALAEKAKQYPNFAISFSDELFQIWEHADTNLKPRLEKELLTMLEFGLSCLQNEQPFDYVKAGHLFSKTGGLFQREDFLLLAIALFEKALSETTATPLVRVYLADAKERRATLLAKTGKLAIANSLREKVRNDYLNDWKKFGINISYLSHAVEYLLAYLIPQPPTDISKDVIENVNEMALKAAVEGKGFYFFPYKHLFWTHLLLGRESEARLWLARGYFTLNILIETELKNLKAAVEHSHFSNQAGFIQSLITHLNTKADKSVYKGPPSAEDVAQLTMDTFETWLQAPKP
jgi:hypothetical protein